MEKQLVSRVEAAQALNISVDTLDELASRNMIRRLKINSKTCFHVDEVKRFANELMTKGAVNYA